MTNPRQQSEIAKQAQELRRQRHFTQADLSRMTGVAKSDISRFESGRAAPTTRTIDRIAKALGARVVLVPDEAPHGAAEQPSADGPVRRPGSP